MNFKLSNLKVTMLIGILIVFMSFYNLYTIHTFYDNAKSTTATIEGIRESSKGSGFSSSGTKKSFMVSYTLGDDEKYSNVTLPYYTDKKEAGDKIKIYYEINKPTDIRFKDKPYFASSIALVMGAIVTYLGVSSTIKDRKKNLNK